MSHIVCFVLRLVVAILACVRHARCSEVHHMHMQNYMHITPFNPCMHTCKLSSMPTCGVRLCRRRRCHLRQAAAHPAGGLPGDDGAFMLELAWCSVHVCICATSRAIHFWFLKLARFTHISALPGSCVRSTLSCKVHDPSQVKRVTHAAEEAEGGDSVWRWQAPRQGPLHSAVRALRTCFPLWQAQVEHAHFSSAWNKSARLVPGICV